MSNVSLRFYRTPQRATFTWKGDDGKTLRLYIVPKSKVDDLREWARKKYSYLHQPEKDWETTNILSDEKKGREITIYPLDIYAGKQTYETYVFENKRYERLKKVTERWSVINCDIKKMIDKAKSRVTTPHNVSRMAMYASDIKETTEKVCASVQNELCRDIHDLQVFLIIFFDHGLKISITECDQAFQSLSQMYREHDITMSFSVLTVEFGRSPTTEEIRHYIATGEKKKIPQLDVASYLL